MRPITKAWLHHPLQQQPAVKKVFAGPVDDPFFVDLGGIFDLGDAPRQSGAPRDGIAKYNVHTLALEIDISTLQKDGRTAAQAKSILDDDYIIGVWASASRKKNHHA